MNSRERLLHLNTLEKVCSTVGDIVDIIRFGDDLGMDTGPSMSSMEIRAGEQVVIALNTNSV